MNSSALPSRRETKNSLFRFAFSLRLSLLFHSQAVTFSPIYSSFVVHSLTDSTSRENKILIRKRKPPPWKENWNHRHGVQMAFRVWAREDGGLLIGIFTCGYWRRAWDYVESMDFRCFSLEHYNGVWIWRFQCSVPLMHSFHPACPCRRTS